MAETNGLIYDIVLYRVINWLLKFAPLLLKNLTSPSAFLQEILADGIVSWAPSVLGKVGASLLVPC